MPEPAQFFLAAAGGLAFGAFIYLRGMSWRWMVYLLVVLWTLQTAPQYLYRWLDGDNVAHEVINVTILRLSFTVAAVLGLLLAKGWRGLRA